MRSRVTAWRRAIAALALALTVGLLAACGDDSSNTPRARGPGDGPVEGTLTYYNFQPTADENEWWDDFIADFEAKYPKATIKTTLYSTQDYWIKTLAAFSSGNEPDIFIPTAGEDLNKYIRAGKIAPLDELVDLDVYNQAALDPFKAVNGLVNGVPTFSFVILGWANDDLLSEHGLAAPTTWDELLEACATLSDAGVVPIAMGNAGQDRFTTEHLLDTIVYQYGGLDATLKATYAEDGTSWDSPAIVKAAERMRELIDAKCFPRGFTGLNYAQMTGLFVQGKAAMTFTGSWISNQVTTSGAKFKASTFPFPDAPDAENSTANLDGILGGVSGLSVSAKAAERNPALVAAFLNEFGKRVDEYANETGSISVAVDPQPQGSELQKAMTATFKDVKQLASVSDTILPRSITEQYLADIVALTLGKLTPDAFAAGMAEKADSERASLPPRDQD